METVVLEQHSGTHIIFHSIKPVYRRWWKGQALLLVLIEWRADSWCVVCNVLYGSNRIAQDLLRICSGFAQGVEWSLGGYGSEWYKVAVGAVWRVAQRVLADNDAGVRAVWIKALDRQSKQKLRWWSDCV